MGRPGLVLPLRPAVRSIGVAAPARAVPLARASGVSARQPALLATPGWPRLRGPPLDVDLVWIGRSSAPTVEPARSLLHRAPPRRA